MTALRDSSSDGSSNMFRLYLFQNYKLCPSKFIQLSPDGRISGVEIFARDGSWSLLHTN
jgi:hypothetical protein